LKSTLSLHIISSKKLEENEKPWGNELLGQANAGSIMHWPRPNENLEVSSRTGQT